MDKRDFIVVFTLFSLQTFDTDIQTVKNVKRFHPIFQGYRGGPDKKRHPKMEGVDVVVLSDEEEDDNEGREVNSIKNVCYVNKLEKKHIVQILVIEGLKK